MQLYKTYNMEQCVRKMVERYTACVVIKQYFCRRHIAFRNNLLYDLELTSTFPSSKSFDNHMRRWRDKKGVLVYKPNHTLDKMPEANAILFVEPPLSYHFFEKYATRAKRDCVIYCPPNFDFQEEKLERDLPQSHYAHAIHSAIKSIQHEPMSHVELAVLGLCKLRRCYNLEFLTTMTGLDELQLRKCLAKTRWKWEMFARYEINYEPEDPFLKAHFDQFCSELQNGFLKRDRFSAGFIAKGWLTRQNCITRKEVIFGITERLSTPYELIDAVANAKRAEWYKMRLMIESAPEY